jgi:hypothetical protein
MKTLTRTLLMTAMMGAATATANAAGPTNFGTYPGYFGNATAGCPGGNCPTGTCRNGECGLGGCANGQCGISAGRGLLSANPFATQTAALGYTSLQNNYGRNPYYAGVPTSSCPSGNCPLAQSQSYRAGYAPQAPLGGCATGNCPVTAVPRYPMYQQPRFSFLGLRW